MKSKITVEIDFENGNRPVIQVHERNSDDVRDKLIDAVFQELGHHSRWFRVEYKHETITDGEQGSLWHLIPVSPKEYTEEIKLMAAHREQHLPAEKIEYPVQDNSDGFRRFLDKEEYEWKPDGHMTLIKLFNPSELFHIGRKLELYKAANPNG